MCKRFQIRGSRSRGRFGRIPLVTTMIGLLLASAAAAQTPSEDAAAAASSAREIALSSVGVNLNITPRRVTLDRDTRTASVFIFNQGDAPATFDISLVDRLMMPDGEIRAVADGSPHPDWSRIMLRLQSAAPYIVVAPRRVTLQPGRGQTIRLRATPPPDGTAGAEYRTHLTVTNIPPPDAGLTAEAAVGQGTDEVTFSIQSIFGLSIPIILRDGAPDVRARIEEPHLMSLPAPPDSGVATQVVAEFSIVREGPNSIFGDIEIRSESQGDELIGVARGVGVYPEIDGRTMQVALSRPPLPQERLRITLTDNDTRPGDELARIVLQAP